MVTLFGSIDSYNHNVKICIKEMEIGNAKFSGVVAIPNFGLVLLIYEVLSIKLTELRKLKI